MDKAHAIAASTGVHLEWLATGEGPMRPGEAVEPVIDDSKFVGIPRLNASLSAGGGGFNEDTVEVLDHIPFTAEFLGKRLGRTSAEGLIIIAAKGDSMDSTIADGDLVMIDQRQKDLSDGIFAFVLNGVALIKRIHPTLDGRIEVISDNSRYDKEILSAEAADHFQLIGKVVWCGHHFSR